MEILIKTIGLKKFFKVKGGQLHAVDGIDIEIEKGKTLGVVGESGCGKTTLGRLILRLIKATSGQIFFEDEDILKYESDKMKIIRKKMQIIFQDPFSSLDPRLSIFELIAEPLIINRVCRSKKEMKKKINTLMDTVGISERFINSYPHEIDGGRRQRVGIARALALDPKFIVCDEPVSALDVSIQAQILNLLMDLQEEMGLTYMFITHNLSVVKHISEKIIVMYLGKCVEWAESQELYKNPMHPYTRTLLSSIPVPQLGGKQRKIIKGELSDPINPKPGCRFAPRCDFVRNDCYGEEIQLKEVSKGHFVACKLC